MREVKTKPELRRQIMELERRIWIVERFLEDKGLLEQASQFVEKSLEEMEEIPFD